MHSVLSIFSETKVECMPSIDFRFQSVKLLIEVGLLKDALKVLRMVEKERDDIAELWYLKCFVHRLLGDEVAVRQAARRGKAHLLKVKLPWREAGPPKLDDAKVDLDQAVVNKELSLCSRWAARRCRATPCPESSSKSPTSTTWSWGWARLRKISSKTRASARRRRRSSGERSDVPHHGWHGAEEPFWCV